MTELLDTHTGELGEERLAFRPDDPEYLAVVRMAEKYPALLLKLALTYDELVNITTLGTVASNGKGSHVFDPPLHAKLWAAYEEIRFASKPHPKRNWVSRLKFWR